MMELIFFYINQSKTKFIEKQGFNFSSRYRFSVEYDKGTYILKGNECEKRLNTQDFVRAKNFTKKNLWQKRESKRPITS